MSRLITLAGVKWSCLRIDNEAFPPAGKTSLARALSTTLSTAALDKNPQSQVGSPIADALSPP